MKYTEPDHIETMAARWLELSDAGNSTKRALETLAAEYPEMTREQFNEVSRRVIQIGRDRIAAIEAHQALMLEVDEVCGSLWRANPHWTMEQCLERVAVQGSKRAAELLAIVREMPPIPIPPE
jgi:hypothetical protein